MRFDLDVAQHQLGWGELLERVRAATARIRLGARASFLGRGMDQSYVSDVPF